MDWPYFHTHSLHWKNRRAVPCMAKYNMGLDRDDIRHCLFSVKGSSIK
ncbi:hypothetical protein JCM19236_3303 [Vibrio sp. JCM 19236]|nr:hypothetical protein JCM19236_3303 [Vibrio sp. JCM 19236]